MQKTEAAHRHDGTYVTNELRRAITAGELAPNQRLIEVDLTEQYDASRGAVRLALANLAAEGLVERIQNRGSRVRAIDLDEALEIVELRAALESICAGKAADHADDAGIAQLRAIGERMRKAVKQGDTETYSAANRELHELILRLSAMKVAPGVVSRLRAQNVRYQIRLARHHNRPTVSLPEHLEIIEAISNHDAPRAASAMKTHLTSVLEATRAYFS
jgi:DNA-binding GntR family transcriptional regulator